MASIKISLRNNTYKKLKSLLQQAKAKGEIHTITKILVIFAVATTKLTYELISKILKVSTEFIRLLINNFIIKGFNALKAKKSPGRPPKLSKSQKCELKELIKKGPAACGFPGACWRTPMIQTLIYEKFGVFYNVNYLAELLKNLGFTFQKAKFVADEKDGAKRKTWVAKHWPAIKKLAVKKQAFILFGDEASFPQWGSLSYTWAERGKQPTVKTSGVRKAYKIFGLIDYFTGHFFYKAHEGRLNSDSYQLFLSEVLSKNQKTYYFDSRWSSLSYQQSAGAIFQATC